MEATSIEVKRAINQHKGPMEGMVIVNGRPEMEISDMPVLYIRSVEDVQRLSAIMEAVNKQLEDEKKDR